MKRVVDFEVLDHGVEHSQYFQGCGIAFTSFTDVVTGIGSSFGEAVEDALDSLAQNDWDADDLAARILADMGKAFFPHVPSVQDDEEDVYYHVSIQVR